nr:hypothetical protein BCV26_05260 [Vibrio cyclitrophicus]
MLVSFEEKLKVLGRSITKGKPFSEYYKAMKVGESQKHATIPVNDLSKLINPKLRGWANYYRHCVAKQIFGYVGHKLFQALWHWAVRRHPTKSKDWVVHKYFLNRKGQW